MSNGELTHDEMAELLGVYALDAVDPDEREMIEAHLVDCARCRAEVAEHREVAALLANGGADAPEGLWDRIAGTLDEAPPALDLTNVAPMRPRSASTRWRPNNLAVALTAAAAVVIAFLGVQIRDQDQRIDELQTALRDPMTPAYQAALDDPGTQTFTLTSADGQVVVRGAVTENGRGFLSAQSLPELPDDRTYQLWGAAGDQLVSLGVLGNRPTVVSFLGDPYGTFAITEETAAGVVQSENPPVVAGSLS